jgi:hypothetical protein
VFAAVFPLTLGSLKQVKNGIYKDGINFVECIEKLREKKYVLFFVCLQHLQILHSPFPLGGDRKKE